MPTDGYLDAFILEARKQQEQRQKKVIASRQNALPIREVVKTLNEVVDHFWNGLVDKDAAVHTLLALGELLQELCLDFRLREYLRDDAGLSKSDELAIQILLTACAADRRKMNDWLDKIQENRALRVFVDVDAHLQSIAHRLVTDEQSNGPPWTPPIKGGAAALDRLLDKTESTTRQLVKRGNWVRDADRFRSKNAVEQRAVLHRLREN